jgi:hypothetical protein
MRFRGSIGTLAVVALLMSMAPAQAFDDAQYPGLYGLWRPVNFRVGGQGAFDQTKPWGRAQQAPLTPEYQAVHDASIADQANGGQGNWHSGSRCLPPGMPATMNVYGEMEIVVLPEVTYILLNHNSGYHRRIFTDGRNWPKDVEPSFHGYSIGKWIDEDGDSRFDALEVETRHFKGPRALDPTGLPVHADNQSIVKERIYFNKTDPTLLHNEITLIDNAFTRPWTVLKNYRRDAGKYPRHTRQDCSGTTANILIGKELYYLSADRKLMPTRKDQPPPDVRHFNQPQK